MSRIGYVLKLMLLIFSIFITDYEDILAWDNEVTHRDLSRYGARGSVLNTDKGDYLKNLGFDKGMVEILKWTGNSTIKQGNVEDWLQEGSDLEDAGNKVDLALGRARSYNHFHNPLKQWDQAGLNDFYTVLLPYPPYVVTYSMVGESALVWAQAPAYQGKYITLEGDQTWQTSRLYFYNALTGKELTYRDEKFAMMFKVLGHQMHLIQDMAVPAHVRNDAHPEDALIGTNYVTGDLLFETYAKSRVGMINDLAANAVVPQVDLTKNPGNMVSIAWNDKKRGLI